MMRFLNTNIKIRTVVDEALYDDAVTENEFRAIWEKGRAFFQWNFAEKKGAK